MKYLLKMLLVTSFGLVCGMAAFAATPHDAVAAHRYLVGTWQCTYTVGNVAGSYTTTWTTALDDTWLKETYDQPPVRTAMMKGDKLDAAGFRAEYLMGYDPRHDAWVRFGAMTTGQYFAIRMTPTPNGGWTWKYQSFFPRRRPESAQPDATFARKSDVLYTVDGPTYPNEQGATVTEHHICRKR